MPDVMVWRSGVRRLQLRLLPVWCGTQQLFLLYVVILMLGIVTLGVVGSRPDLTALASLGLAILWLGTWGAYAFAGRPTPIEPEAFKVVAALDVSLMVPALAVGGVLLWRRRPWGYLIATTAAIQGALYLLVLSVNSAIAIRRGLAAAPGELEIWGPLTLFTTAAAVVLLRNAGVTTAHRRQASRRPTRRQAC